MRTGLIGTDLGFAVVVDVVASSIVSFFLLVELCFLCFTFRSVLNFAWWRQTATRNWNQWTYPSFGLSVSPFVILSFCSSNVPPIRPPNRPQPLPPAILTLSHPPPPTHTPRSVSLLTWTETCLSVEIVDGWNCCWVSAFWFVESCRLSRWHGFTKGRATV